METVFRSMEVPFLQQTLRLFVFLCIWATAAGHASARTITDMAGRVVTVPDQIKRVVPYDNKTNVVLFPVAGDLMVAKARSRENPMLQCISSEFLNIREVDTKNHEEVLKLKPDIILVAAFTSGIENLSNYASFSVKTGIPMVFVDLDLMHLDKSFEFLGTLLGRETQAVICADFIRSIYREAMQYKNNSTVKGKVYVANETSGLRTVPAGSNHAQVLDVMGIGNVALTGADTKGFAHVSLEQVMMWNPDYIVCLGKSNNSPYRQILKSPMWKSINAVKRQKVFNVPSSPYLWFDMPPSINRLLALVWFSELFYQQPAVQTQQKVTEFYRIFYKYTLTDSDYRKLFAWQ
ncbi:MAG: ABC transporter substrate-binding protein [Breznakibacter sp.]